MPDIAKCPGKGCPLRESCYRFTSEPSVWQSWMSEPFDHKTEDCEYYWPIIPRELVGD